MLISPHESIVSNYYTGLSAMFTLIAFTLLYVLFWKTIRNDIIGKHVRRLASWLMRIQAFLVSAAFSAIVYVLGTELSDINSLTVISALAVFILLQLLHELTIRRVSASAVKPTISDKDLEGTTLFGRKASSFFKTIRAELKLVLSALKQDKKLSLVRTIIAFTFCSVFCHIFIIPFAVISGWIFGPPAVYVGGNLVFPTSFIIVFLVDRRLKKRFISNPPAEAVA